MSNRQILGVCGALVLLLGVFSPIASIPLLGSLNYLHSGREAAAFLLFLVAVSLFLALLNRCGGLMFTGVAALTTLGYTFQRFQESLREFVSEAAEKGMDTPLDELAELAAGSVQLQWGWAVLVIGSLLLVISAGMREETGRQRRAAGVIGGTAAAAQSEGAVRGREMPHPAGAARRFEKEFDINIVLHLLKYVAVLALLLVVPFGVYYGITRGHLASLPFFGARAPEQAREITPERPKAVSATPLALLAMHREEVRRTMPQDGDKCFVNDLRVNQFSHLKNVELLKTLEKRIFASQDRGAWPEELLIPPEIYPANIRDVVIPEYLGLKNLVFLDGGRCAFSEGDTNHEGIYAIRDFKWLDVFCDTGNKRLHCEFLISGPALYGWACRVNGAGEDFFVAPLRHEMVSRKMKPMPESPSSGAVQPLPFAPQEAAGPPVFYYNTYEQVFHRVNCPQLGKNAKPIELREATGRKMKPCGECRPLYISGGRAYENNFQHYRKQNREDYELGSSLPPPPV